MATLFPGKLRQAPITFTATQEHRARLTAATMRLKISRADVIGILIEKHLDGLTLDGFPTPPARSPALPVYDAFGRRPQGDRDERD